MSVRSNGNNDRLEVVSAWSAGTGDFSIGFWVRAENDNGNDFQDLFTIGDAANGSTYITLFILAVGAGFDLDLDASASGPLDIGAFALSLDTWYFVVLSRSGTTLRLRVFDDTASTTPLFDDTQATFAVDFTSAYDTLRFGQFFTGEWVDAEFRSGAVHNGVAWTDAQCRTESQTAGIQTAGGTPWGAWDLQDVDADAAGLNDLTGNARNLANTGCIADATNNPAQMAAQPRSLPPLRPYNRIAHLLRR